MSFPDGERGDSYRRIFRWYSNALRVEAEPTRRSMMDALARGRAWAVMEALGDAAGVLVHGDASRRGAYRAEAVVTPHHARPYLPGMERLIREVPWVYSNVIRVE